MASVSPHTGSVPATHRTMMVLMSQTCSSGARSGLLTGLGSVITFQLLHRLVHCHDDDVVQEERRVALKCD